MYCVSGILLVYFKEFYGVYIKLFNITNNNNNFYKFSKFFIFSFIKKKLEKVI